MIVLPAWLHRWLRVPARAIVPPPEVDPLQAGELARILRISYHEGGHQALLAAAGIEFGPIELRCVSVPPNGRAFEGRIRVPEVGALEQASYGSVPSVGLGGIAAEELHADPAVDARAILRGIVNGDIVLNAGDAALSACVDQRELERVLAALRATWPAVQHHAEAAAREFIAGGRWRTPVVGPWT